MITREFNLYLNAGVAVAPIINANQFDQSEQWIFNLLQSDGTKYTPSTGAIIGLKQDGTTILNAGTVNSAGQVVITETEQMTAVPGSNIFEILIDGTTHGTANFVVFVERRPGDIDNPSESDISLFQEAISAAGNITQFEADIDNLKDDVDDLQTGLAQETSQRQTQDAVLNGRVSEAVTAVGETGETTLFDSTTTPLWYTGQTITLSESYKNFDYLDFYVQNLGREKIYRYAPDTTTILLRSVNLVDLSTDVSMRIYETIVNLDAQSPYTSVTCQDASSVVWSGNTSNNAERISYTESSGYQSSALQIYKIVGVKLCATNPEVTDIRVGYDGTTYPSAGDAVRGQVEDLHDEVDALTDVVENKADVNGNYDDLTVGTADQLMADTYTTDAEPYVFRKSGGSASVGTREKDTIVGGSVAYNQLVQNGNFATGSKSPFSGSAWTATVGEIYTNITGTVAINVTLPLVPTHKYMLIFEAKQDSQIAGSFKVGYNSASLSGSILISSIFADKPVGQWFKSGRTFVIPSDTTVTEFGLRFGAVSSSPLQEGEVVHLRNIMLFDLTQMFDSSVADAVYDMYTANHGADVLWFRSMYPLDYYAYNTGTMEHVNGLTSHDMVGFNQWDEEWEQGGIDTSGNFFNSTVLIRGKNYYKCLPNIDYYFKAPVYLRVVWYDADKNYIIHHEPQNNTRTSPSNARYFRFSTITGSLTTYNNDICINISSDKDGTYESYTKHSYALDSSLTLRGIPKWNNGLYYDGDTYSADGTVTRKYGVVDLGVQPWSYGANVGYFYTDIAGKKAGNHNLKCVKYVTTTGDSASDMPDKQIKGNAINTNIYIKDSAYTDAQAFKTAMSGVYLVYELATPTTETAEPYTNPQIVSPYGTEEYVTTGITAVGHDTQYPTDLKGKLENLPSIPTAPTTAGTYVLKATVTSSGVTYQWVAQS